MRRFVIAVGLLGWLVGSMAPAVAGGWAVTTIVEKPDSFAAGEAHEVGFEIRQHGVQLVTAMDDVAIVLRRVDAAAPALRFPATVEGTRWYAEVVAPVDGEWTWAVQPGWFATVELGALPMRSPSGSGTVQPGRLAAGAALALGGAALLLVRRRPATAAS